MIKIDSAIEIVSIKSNIPLGNGTIIIVKIAIIKKTIPRSFEPTINLKSGRNNSILDDFFFAKKTILLIIILFFNLTKNYIILIMCQE